MSILGNNWKLLVGQDEVTGQSLKGKELSLGGLAKNYEPDPTHLYMGHISMGQGLMTEKPMRRACYVRVTQTTCQESTTEPV